MVIIDVICPLVMTNLQLVINVYLELLRSENVKKHLLIAQRNYDHQTTCGLSSTMVPLARL